MDFKSPTVDDADLVVASESLLRRRTESSSSLKSSGLTGQPGGSRTSTGRGFREDTEISEGDDGGGAEEDEEAEAEAADGDGDGGVAEEAISWASPSLLLCLEIEADEESRRLLCIFPLFFSRIGVRKLWPRENVPTSVAFSSSTVALAVSLTRRSLSL